MSLTKKVISLALAGSVLLGGCQIILPFIKFRPDYSPDFTSSTSEKTIEIYEDDDGRARRIDVVLHKSVSEPVYSFYIPLAKVDYQMNSEHGKYNIMWYRAWGASEDKIIHFHFEDEDYNGIYEKATMWLPERDITKLYVFTDLDSDGTFDKGSSPDSKMPFKEFLYEFNKFADKLENMLKEDLKAGGYER